MGEASYPWPVPVWFCDYCDHVAGVVTKPDECPRCKLNSVSGPIDVAPVFHWADEKAGLLE